MKNGRKEGEKREREVKKGNIYLGDHANAGGEDGVVELTLLLAVPVPSRLSQPDIKLDR